MKNNEPLVEVLLFVGYLKLQIIFLRKCIQAYGLLLVVLKHVSVALSNRSNAVAAAHI